MFILDNEDMRCFQWESKGKRLSNATSFRGRVQLRREITPEHMDNNAVFPLKYK